MLSQKCLIVWIWKWHSSHTKIKTWSLFQVFVCLVLTKVTASTVSGRGSRWHSHNGIKTTYTFKELQFCNDGGMVHKTGMSEGVGNHDMEGFFCLARESCERNLTKEFEAGEFETSYFEGNSTIYNINWKANESEWLRN